MANSKTATEKRKRKKDEIIVDKKVVEIFTCPRCESKFREKSAAETCLRTDRAIELAKKAYIDDHFLLVGKEIISVWKMEIPPDRFGGYCQIIFKHVDFSGEDCINVNTAEGWLKRGIKSITISEAVEMGWRAFSQSCWEKRATPKMKREYSKAINKVIAGLSEKKKQKIIRQSIMFEQQ